MSFTKPSTPHRGHPVPTPLTWETWAGEDDPERAKPPTGVGLWLALLAVVAIVTGLMLLTRGAGPSQPEPTSSAAAPPGASITSFHDVPLPGPASTVHGRPFGCLWSRSLVPTDRYTGHEACYRISPVDGTDPLTELSAFYSERMSRWGWGQPACTPLASPAAGWRCHWSKTVGMTVYDGMVAVRLANNGMPVLFVWVSSYGGNLL
jgi:hypothetical protein